MSSSFTAYGWSLCLWVLILAFQYGYHTSVLNQIQAVLTCSDTIPQLRSSRKFYAYGLPTCLLMSEFTFSFITAIFTLGGLVGSIASSRVMEKYGRRGASAISALLVTLGAGLMGVSPSIALFGCGRLLVGIGSGIGLCVGPIYLSEIAPKKISGNVGVLTQLAIVLGIMLTQALGLRFSSPTQWRLVLFLSSSLSLIQLITTLFAVESPAYLRGSSEEERTKVCARLWGADVRDVEDDPLLREHDDDQVEARRAQPTESLSAARLFHLSKTDRTLRTPLLVVCLAMLCQQLCGINAVLAFSNSILGKALPTFAPYVSLGVTVVNVFMTFPPIILIERMGRKQLLSISTIGAITSLLLLGIGLDNSIVWLSSIAIVTFIMSFAIGLGPIPFVIIPEVSPFHAVSAMSSVALSLNWIANFTVGLIFLPLRTFLSGTDPLNLKEGRVFYVFACVLFVTAWGLRSVYR